ncbi:lamin tail domain-containing protein, partial [bacterium]|nr:lamin tail domain-containing protein [bacterium]
MATTLTEPNFAGLPHRKRRGKIAPNLDIRSVLDYAYYKVEVSLTIALSLMMVVSVSSHSGISNINPLTFTECAVRKLGQALAILILTLYCSGVRSQVLINEMMYHDVTNDRAEEFVELYNAGAGAVNLEGWRFTGGITFVFPARVVIEGGGYVVLCADSAMYVLRHPEVLNIVGDFTGRLSNGGETITLLDELSRVVDSVGYGDSYPWPSSADGDGPSLELIHPLLDSDAAASWEASFNDGGTPGRVNSVFSKQRPAADAGEDRFVAERSIVSLDGSGSEDEDGEIVSFAWIQTSGPTVTVVGGETSTPRFESP